MRRFSHKVTVFVLALVLLLATAVSSSADGHSMNVVETAKAAGQFNTLVAALEATGLDAVLSDESAKFTVFAPTDNAFAALGQDTIDALLADPDTLSDILLYHVIAGTKLRSKIILDNRVDRTLEMANGDRVSVTLDNGNLFINDAQVVVADVMASNGIIHVIDTVLIPPADPVNIVETAKAVGQFNTLVAALEATGLDAVLSDESAKFTVFAPTDDAFAALGQDTIDALLADPDTLSDILLYHVIAGTKLRSKIILDNRVDRTLEMANHDRVSVTLDNGNLFINDAQVIITDVMASNGIIHVIDAVLIPPTE